METAPTATVLYDQGRAAGRAGAQGIVILDFGRPADSEATFGTIDFSGKFVPFSAIASGVESYLRGYLLGAPAATRLDVAIGTNNSCGTGQPCGGRICGCVAEPASFLAWGEAFASLVETVGSWTDSLVDRSGFTDVVQVVGADDAEPAYDPGFTNTYEVLSGFAERVGGPSPAMVDFGSAESHYWTAQQLFEVAFGLAPDVPMPEIYFTDQVGEWTSLLRYARDRGTSVTVFGVLVDRTLGVDATSAYEAMQLAVAGSTGQRSIPWLSRMAN